ncbi:hypothetical protein LZP46_01050 [Acinetobacter sp. SCLZS86]|uniref:hypothetical protein n=1 Tax=Acinetobacter sp. SCLZS86 TaxID=2908637 RepID=UPI001F1C9DB6|nr:hypothetical protein [Acinetobacter sp. SCLZS86]UIZ57775.1 hypothetical protein LZP46_01050 [Acinetobacter sp. SCLZS86]
MAYYSGLATNFSDLLSALKTACMASGWIVNGDIFSKNACFVKLSALTAELRIEGGTGANSGNLTGGPSADCYCRIMNFGSQIITWPVNYNIHLTDSDVFLCIKYNVSCYQWMAWGVASVFGNLGTGNWFGASVPFRVPNPPGINMGINPIVGDSYQGTPVPFWDGGNMGAGRFRCSYIHVEIDGLKWLGESPTSPAVATMVNSVFLDRQPNSWNGESIFLPFLLSVARASSKISCVAELNDCRLVRIEHYEPEQIITLGPEKWMIYPFYKKNILAPSGGGSINHTGTFGWAIRYDGP